jgi:hypothetical protein
MLAYARPYGSKEEQLFIARYLAPLPGIEEDAYGNLTVKIGQSPILWSSHTDTVHRKPGYQTLRINDRDKTIRLSRRSKRHGSSCLGADDTVGVFLMREMILRNVPGLYVFHAGEEVGGVGSQAIAEYRSDLLTGISFAIALDRQGTADVVTHQFGGRTASDAFAVSLAKQLPGKYAPVQGVFTDTANYADLIPECSNISVGYYRQHSKDEYVDYPHVDKLLTALCAIDSAQLTCARDPRVKAPPVYQGKFDHRFDPLWMRPDTWGMPAQHSVPVAYNGSLSDEHWCYVCGAPILPADTAWADYPADDDYCLCSTEQDTLSEDDLRFLKYLRGLDD